MKNKDDLLNPYYIRDFLPLESRLLVPVIQVFDSTDSTNNILMEKNCIYPNGHTCFAEEQTNARGVSGNRWQNVNKNICFSVAWNFKENSLNLHMLNFLVAIKLIEALDRIGYIGIQAKWPNDIIYEGFKIGGILIDIKFKKNSQIFVVLGVGINLELSSTDKKNIDQKASDLQSVDSKIKLDRNKFSAELLGAIIECLSQFEKYDYKKLSDEWNRIDYNFNKVKMIEVCNNEIIEVQIKGINANGQLCCLYKNKLNNYNFNEVKIIKDEILRN
tara:strand:- start:1433 stop:2254 length:822 start_codon:yes stop_codon:yes gene_type:complete